MKTKHITTILLVLLVIVAIVLGVLRATDVVTFRNGGNGTTVDNGLEPDEQANLERYQELVEEAREAMVAEDYDKAVRLAEKALEYGEAPNVHSVFYASYKELGQYGKAEDSLTKLIDAAPANPQFWIEYAVFAQGDLDKSTTAINALYKDAIVAVKKNALGTAIVDIYTSYARFLAYTVEDFSQAIEYLELAKALNPERADIYDQEIADLQEEL